MSEIIEHMRPGEERRSLIDRWPPAPSISWQVVNSAATMALVKHFGELPRLEWKVIISCWVLGVVIGFLKAIVSKVSTPR